MFTKSTLTKSTLSKATFTKGTFTKGTGLILSLFFVFSCAEQNTTEQNMADKSADNKRVPIALSKGDESMLAEAILCAGASEILADVTSTAYPALMDWQATFNTIADNAKDKAMSFKGQDGAAIETRLEQIRVQTRDALERYESQDNADKMSTFVEQTLEQCTGFAA